MTTPTLSDEVTYVSGIDANGKVAATSFDTWDFDSSPATYNNVPSDVVKWGSTTPGTADGTVQVYIDPSWSGAAVTSFEAALALWSAVTNISFTYLSSAPADPATYNGIYIAKGSDGRAYEQPSYFPASGAGVIGGPKTWTFDNSTISIDPSVAGFGPIDGTFSTAGGYPWTTILHELGHSIGLGHDGPYNDGDSIDPPTHQYSPYDSRLYSIMSYIDPRNTSATYYSQYPVTGTNWGNVAIPVGGGSYQIWPNSPTTMMPLDILAAQRLYGTPTSTPLSGGQTFGFNESGFGTAGAAIAPFFDFTQNTHPVVTLFDTGTGNTLDLSGFTTSDTVNLTPGTYSSAGTAFDANAMTMNMVNNIAIAYGTLIDTLFTGSGNDTITGNNDGDIFHAGTGTNTITGGTGVDTAVMLGTQASYTITHNGDGSVTVSKSGESDTFTNIERIAFGDQTVSLSGTTAFDFNGDGKSDILWQNDSGAVAMWLMNGTTITAYSQIPGNSDPTWKIKATGDFDGDGKSDILWQNDSGAVAMWLMNGTAITTAAQIPGNSDPTWKIKATGDFNGDGKSDILWQNDSGAVAMWLMNGTTITAYSQIPGNSDPTWKIKATGDFDGDGKSDILWQNDSGAVAMWLMNGTAITTAAQIPGNSDPTWKIKATGDFNGDGKSDILWQNDSGAVAMWLMNGTTITTAAQIPGNSDPTWKIKATGDFNGDGKSDILWQNDSGAVAMWLMNGTAITTAAQIPGNSDPAWHVIGPNATGKNPGRDFDGDGKSDILWQNDSGAVAMWLMNGTAITTAAQIPGNSDPTWKIKATGDFNGDGKSDILWQNDSGAVAMWLMNGTTITAYSQIPGNSDPTWKIKATGDFDGDGKSDILWQNDSGAVAMWLMNGTAITTAAQIPGNSDPTWKIKATGDFNGDGKSDILWQNDSGAVAMWLMNGTTITAYSQIPGNSDPTWKIKATGDFDGDGKSDILWQNDSGAVAMWLMNGTAITTAAQIPGNSDPTWKIKATGDFNGDGKSDILWQNDSGAVGVWLMNGTAISSSTVMPGNGSAAWHIVAGSGA